MKLFKPTLQILILMVICFTANHTMFASSGRQASKISYAISQHGISNNNFHQQKLISMSVEQENTTLICVIGLEVLVSILVFLKLGMDYLKSNKPYLPKADLQLNF